jgi:hypothetical protein
MEITDLTGLSEPLKRLIEVISSGIGNVYKPYLIRKTADAKAYEIKVIANAMAESKKLLTHTEYEDGKVKVLAEQSEDFPTLQNRADARIQYRGQCEQQNVEAVCVNAAEELLKETTVPDGKPEPEWISRFFDISSGINSEELQFLWGRILAGEIKRPGSFSLRTLDVLRNLSRKEAENFVKLGNYILRSNEKVFYVDPTAYIFAKDGGLTFLDILALKHAGLVFESDLEFSFAPSSAGQMTHLTYGSLLLIFEREKDTQKLGSNIGLLTPVGIELLELLTVQPDMEYLEFVGRRFAADGLKSSWAPILGIVGDQINFGTKTYIGK